VNLSQKIRFRQPKIIKEEFYFKYKKIIQKRIFEDTAAEFKIGDPKPNWK
jgi:hypothetical protein